MDEDIKKRLDKQDEKLEKIYKYVRRINMYFLVSFISSILLIVLPLIGLAIILPKVIDTYMNAFEGLM